MSTFVDFVPSSAGPFTFQATLSGVVYNVIVTWNVFGQRFYLNLYDVSGDLVLARALSSSGAALVASLSWANSIATAVLPQPHLVPIGSVAAIDVSGTGVEFDGAFEALATNEVTLTYPLAVNPGEAAQGVASFDLNLLAGYNLGTLLFHEDSQQFEFE